MLIIPLDLLPSLSIRQIFFLVSVIELKLKIRFPSNTCLVDINLFTILIFQLEGIVEYTLCNQTAWDSNVACWERLKHAGYIFAFSQCLFNILFIFPAVLLIIPEVLDLCHWVTITHF